MRLSSRLDHVKPSATLALNQKALELKRAGRDVVALTAGEPDFPAPRHVTEAMKDALDRGRTRYTPVGGIPELKAAIQAHYEERGQSYQASEIIVSTGAKQSVFNALLALIDTGDEAIISAPFWLSYQDMVALAGGRAVVLETKEEDGFLLAPEDLEAAITEHTRVFVLNSPSNPTGAVYSQEQLLALADVLKRHPQVTVIADEIYDRFVYFDGPCPTLLAAAPELRERTVIINGCSKAYAMTGLRIGWALGPQALISAMGRLQGQSTSNACAPAQDAAIAALTGDQSCVTEMVEAFDLRRKFMVGRLRALPGITCFDPQGAFYVFPNLGAYVGRTLPDGSPIDDAFAITGYLLHDHGLVVVPGGPFGAPNHIRLSFAAHMDTLAMGLSRLQEGLSRIV